MADPGPRDADVQTYLTKADGTLIAVEGVTIGTRTVYTTPIPVEPGDEIEWYMTIRLQETP